MPARILATLTILGLTGTLLVHPPLAVHSQTTPFARFAGTWVTHGGGVSIGVHGHGAYRLRTYLPCTTTILTDCDKFKGNTIYPGGVATFTLRRVRGNVAYGVVTTSSTSWEIDTSLSLQLTPRDVLIARGASDLLDHRRFCGPHAPPGSCGA